MAMGKAVGAKGWAMAGYIFGGAAIGAGTAGLGSFLSGAIATTTSFGTAIGSGLGASAISSAVSGAVSNLGFGVLHASISGQWNANEIFKSAGIGALHAAALAGVALTGGLIYEPTMAREIFDRANNVYYQSKTKLLGRAMSQTGAAELKELMEATVSLGTGRRHFSDADQHPLLSGLTIGGKTGTINDVDGTRVEWFVAFSYWPESGSGPVWPLALAAVVASEGKAPVDGQDLIRRALIAYYQPLLDGSGRTYR